MCTSATSYTHLIQTSSFMEEAALGISNMVVIRSTSKRSCIPMPEGPGEGRGGEGRGGEGRGGEGRGGEGRGGEGRGGVGRGGEERRGEVPKSTVTAVN